MYSSYIFKWKPNVVHAAAAVVSTDVDEGDLFLPDDGDLVLYTRERRVPGQPVAVAASSGDAPAPGDVKWTLGLDSHFEREEHRLRVFENKVLRKIFRAKRDEVTGEWRKLHNTELHALYSSPDIIRNIKSRRLRWAGHVARMGESRNAYRVLVVRPEGKRPLGRPRRRWEDDIKIDLREVGYDCRDWINLAQDRDQWRAYVRAAMNLRVSLKGSKRTAGYTLLDRKRNEEILEQLEVESVEEKITRYKFNWLDHVRRMENSRIPKIMMQYKPRGHRRPGRPLRRLLDGAETGLQRPNS
ncbi:hypothetical protein ANN_16037 [Periplaneta americana]|uniref:Uncharacterized protein n=1 Tax=Periplaneta americana TaxID=6978 RepID=A0ABQ8SIT0_PERAM|nr:hypothetical protein ANN_16037 [Periplaneta americana]